MLKRILPIVLMMVAIALQAQNIGERFEQFDSLQNRKFDAFTDSINKEYIEFMRQPWQSAELQPAVKKPKKDTPIEEMVYNPETDTLQNGNASTPLQVSEVVDLSAADSADISQDTTTVAPAVGEVGVIISGMENQVERNARASVAEDAAPFSSEIYMENKKKRLNVPFMGRTLYLNNALLNKCYLRKVDENGVADAYEMLMRRKPEKLLKECIQLRDELKLNDWGMYLLLKEVSNACCRTPNESVVMQYFLLTQLGYRTKVGRKKDSDDLLLCLAVENGLYGYPSFTLKGIKYYCVNSPEPCSFSLCARDKDAPQVKQNVSMTPAVAPYFWGEQVATLHQDKDTRIKVEVDVPQVLVDFYNQFPQCDYDVYIHAAVNAQVSEELLAPLRKQVAGKTEYEAVAFLLKFLHTAFEYGTDEDQFGYSKPCFLEEILYYPQSDCEDRALMFSYLVKHLLGLEVVYLDYEGHVSTAVHFASTDVNGDHFLIEGKKFVVCDPSYRGAPVGRTQTKFRNEQAKIWKF